MAKKRVNDYAYDKIGDTLQKLYTREQWIEAVEETSREAMEREREARTRPPDWVEPSITLEEAEADSYLWQALALMQREGLTVLTRTQYFQYNYSLRGLSKWWTAELEDNLPYQLQDKYGWLPEEPKRRKNGELDH